MRRLIDITVATIASVMIVMFSTFISSLSVSFMGYGRPHSPDYQLWELLSMIVGYVFVLSAYGIYLHYKGKNFIREMGMNHRIFFGGVIASIIAAIIPVVFAVALSFGFPPVNTANENTNDIIQYSGRFGAFVTVFYPVIFAALFEEMLFRGVIGSIFDIFRTNSKLTKTAFIIVNSAIFGFLHLQVTGTPFTIAASLLIPTFSGVVYSVLYMKTKNIVYPIIAHGIYNLIVIFTLLN